MTKKTKKEIVKTISNEIGLTQQKTKEIVQKTFDAIVDILVDEGRIELRKFGVFQVKRRAARKARNPRTGEKVDVAERFVVTFKPGKEMEERVMAMEERENRRLAQEQALDAARAPAEPIEPDSSVVAEKAAESQLSSEAEMSDAAASEADVSGAKTPEPKVFGGDQSPVNGIPSDYLTENDQPKPLSSPNMTRPPADD